MHVEFNKPLLNAFRIVEYKFKIKLKQGNGKSVTDTTQQKNRKYMLQCKLM